MRAKSDEPAQQRDDTLPPKRPPAPSVARHSQITPELSHSGPRSSWPPINVEVGGPLSGANRTYCAHSELFRF